MRGRLKMVEGDPVANGSVVASIDRRVEVTIVLDDVREVELERLKAGVGRDVYVIERIN